MLVGLFIVAGARASLRHAELTAQAARAAGGALARPALGVPANLPLSEAVRQAHEQKLRAMVVVGATASRRGSSARPGSGTCRWTAGRGSSPPTAPAGSSRAWSSTPISPGEALLAAMSQTPASEYLVQGERPRVLVSGDVAAAITT